MVILSKILLFICFLLFVRSEKFFFVVVVLLIFKIIDLFDVLNGVVNLFLKLNFIKFFFVVLLILLILVFFMLIKIVIKNKIVKINVENFFNFL